MRLSTTLKFPDSAVIFLLVLRAIQRWSADSSLKHTVTFEGQAAEPLSPTLSRCKVMSISFEGQYARRWLIMQLVLGQKLALWTLSGLRWWCPVVLVIWYTSWATAAARTQTIREAIRARFRVATGHYCEYGKCVLEKGRLCLSAYKYSVNSCDGSFAINAIV